MIEIKTKEEFQNILNNNNNVIIDFYADWCSPCSVLTPVLTNVSKEYSDINFYKINIEENHEVASEYSINSIPTVMFINNGNVKDEFKGARPANFIKEFIDKNK